MSGLGACSCRIFLYIWQRGAAGPTECNLALKVHALVVGVHETHDRPDPTPSLHLVADLLGEADRKPTGNAITINVIVKVRAALFASNL
jgi:hypothetical protein